MVTLGHTPIELNRLIKRRGTDENQKALTCPIIIQHGSPHLNGTITNQIVTGVEMHKGGLGCVGGWGKLKPLPEKLFFISALSDRLTFVTS